MLLGHVFKPTQGHLLETIPDGPRSFDRRPFTAKRFLLPVAWRSYELISSAVERFSAICRPENVPNASSSDKRRLRDLDNRSIHQLVVHWSRLLSYVCTVWEAYNRLVETLT